MPETKTGSSTKARARTSSSATHGPTRTTRTPTETTDTECVARHRGVERQRRRGQVYTSSEPRALILTARRAHGDTGHGYLRAIGPHTPGTQRRGRAEADGEEHARSADELRVEEHEHGIPAAE